MVGASILGKAAKAIEGASKAGKGAAQAIEGTSKAGKGSAKAITGTGKTEPLLHRGEKPSARPSWQQSELDDKVRHLNAGSTVEHQASFINGGPCKYGASGSIRVDNFVDGLVASEVKNYNLTTNRTGLVKDIVDQAIKHQPHLPPGVRQVFTIDARGQTLTREMRINIEERILERTKGILSKENIKFWE
jgi:hypothetical protein